MSEKPSCAKCHGLIDIGKDGGYTEHNGNAFHWYCDDTFGKVKKQ